MQKIAFTQFSGRKLLINSICNMMDVNLRKFNHFDPLCTVQWTDCVKSREYLKRDGNMDWEEGATKGYEGSGVTFRRESNWVAIINCPPWKQPHPLISDHFMKSWSTHWSTESSLLEEGFLWSSSGRRSLREELRSPGSPGDCNGF